MSGSVVDELVGSAVRGAHEETSGVPLLEEGRVIRRGDDDWLVRMGSASVRARVAPSCLVTPEPGDDVLVLNGRVDWVVLAVVSRPDGRSLAVGDPSRRLLVRGRCVRVVAEDDLSMQARCARLEAEETTIAGKRLTLAGTAMTLAAGTLRAAASAIESDSPASARPSVACGFHTAP